MGFGRKVGGVWWLLLIAGVLLAVAATTTAATASEDSYGGSQRMCEIKCQHWVDLTRRQQCIDFCIKYQLAAAGVKEHDGAIATKDSQRMCEIKCQHWVDLGRRQQCIDFCIRYQRTAAGVKEHDGAITTKEGSYGGSQRMCEIKCQHWVDPARRQQCIDFCIKYQLAAANIKEHEVATGGEDSNGVEEHDGDTATATTPEVIRQVV